MDANIAKAKNIFAQMDTDKDGNLNTEELKNLCRELDWDSTTCPAAIVAFDTNGDEKITVDEFIAYYKLKLTGNKEELFKKVFEKVDKNHNGLIDLNEMIHFASLVGEPVTKEEAQSQLKEIDADKDGNVNFKELYSIFEDCEF
ncbi:EF hand family protein [Trichomonas vaginalis G3]|uniref:EF hand family protein n=1 Tax=Trichomonas vaginalis (strain ATCC PRA-98 / G3) TaxID=412133 RepID=A2F6I5_TRIV3|nr:calcium-binding protein family [Trichomonas vaginalis G3]EAX99483.1 EF hand family protein [Trichomonas vaginalis G3]KAI5538692.1 calcium-binding protein family [Trichomonas vaginalis G3]|eukprot:XP_001312413.1 EF hand family protein [Trichomonas vaginalis G3]